MKGNAKTLPFNFSFRAINRDENAFPIFYTLFTPCTFSTSIRTTRGRREYHASANNSSGEGTVDTPIFRS
jgi:hypothetical protein